MVNFYENKSKPLTKKLLRRNRMRILYRKRKKITFEVRSFTQISKPRTQYILDPFRDVSI